MLIFQIERRDNQMARKKEPKTIAMRKHRPAMTPEARENQMIAYATDLAEQQLLDGTASSQVITHYLKLGSSTARLERELLEARTEAMKSQKKVEELMVDALSAFKKYKGNPTYEE